MAHKTFISYKYSEAKGLRDEIIKKLGSNATYYQGETSSSPDMSDNKTGTIRQKLADMIYDTTVMVVVVSPNMTRSAWMEWEVKYALREQSRNGRTSHADGLVCVVQKDPNLWSSDRYAWARTCNGFWSSAKLFNILVSNMNNKKTWMESPIPSTNKCLYESLSSSYIDIVTEDDFLKNPSYYIDKAFGKSENVDSYNISK